MADEKLENLRVWTSLLKRTIQTTVGIDAPKEHWKALNEIDAVSDDVLASICTSVFPHVYSALFDLRLVSVVDLGGSLHSKGSVVHLVCQLMCLPFQLKLGDMVPLSICLSHLCQQC